MLDATSAQIPLSHLPKRKEKPLDLTMQIICWFDGVAQNNGTLCGVGVA